MPAARQRSRSLAMALAVSATMGMCCLAVCFARTDRLSRFDPIHDRHLHVHEHKIEKRAIERSKHLDAIVDDGHLMSELFQKTAGKELVHLVVFSQQYDG